MPQNIYGKITLTVIYKWKFSNGIPMGKVKMACITKFTSENLKRCESVGLCNYNHPKHKFLLYFIWYKSK